MAGPGVHKTYKLFIGGQFVRTESGRAYQVATPGRATAAPSTPPGDESAQAATGVRDTATVNAPRGSRKDVRDAVSKARAAFDGWAARTAYNRGQILYRMAEMLDARGAEFVTLLGGTPAARREVGASVDTLIWYAGWCDKLHAVAGTVNPVAGPYFTFTLPEPTGVVGIVAPDDPALLGLVRRFAPAVCSGNTVVALVSETKPLAGLVLGEVVATSDVPGGVINLVSGMRRELVSWLASHMDVNAIDVAGCSDSDAAHAEEMAAANIKRVVRSDGEQSLEAAISLMEMKTVWHPIGR